MELLPKNKTIPHVPKILRPELRDIFPIFASMLDIKSFMRLAMTSKGMYQKCMEDKSVRINVDENFSFACRDGDTFCLRPSFVSSKFRKSYMIALRKMKCAINLHSFELGKTISTITAFGRILLDKINVKKIEKLRLCNHFLEWDEVAPLIQDYHVNILEIYDLRDLPPLPVLRSWLQLNLKEFSYNQSVAVDLLFEISSPIPKLSFTGIRNIPKDTFMQILWMIQSGSLLHLILDIEAVDWSVFNKLPFDYADPLPTDRPLLFTRTSEKTRIQEYWFLHWQGGVTTCIANQNAGTLKVFNCEPSEFPPVLLKDEDVLEELKEMCSGVSCLLRHFRTFSESFTMLDPSFKGPLPSERPLYLKASETSFWRLDEADILMHWTWKNGCATRTDSHLENVGLIDHPMLSKYKFWKLLKENTVSSFRLACGSDTEFESWFGDYKTLDNDYVGRLPDERPVVFRQALPARVLLFTGFRFHCRYYYSNREVMVARSATWECPSTPFDGERIVKMLQGECRVNRIFLTLEQFRSCLEQLTVVPFDYSGPLKSDSPLVFVKDTSDGVIHARFFWEDMRTTYCSWGEKEPQGVLFQKSRDRLTNVPPALRSKEHLKTLLEPQYYFYTYYEWFGDFDDFLAFFNEYKTFPFNFKGDLPEERPLVFEDNRNGQEPVRIILREDNSMVKCKWSEFTRGVAYLSHPRGKQSAPPALWKFIV